MPKLFSEYPLLTSLADADRIAVNQATTPGSVYNLVFSDLAAELGRQFTAVNQDSGAFSKGQPVAFNAAGTGLVLAEAANNLLHAVGLARLGVAAGNAESAQLSGTFALADWTNVIGTAALTPRAVYYLSTTAGQLTATAPSAAGQVVQAVGTALSATSMELSIAPAILL